MSRAWSLGLPKAIQDHVLMIFLFGAVAAAAATAAATAKKR